MIEGSKVRLRAWKEVDLPTMTTLRNDVELQKKLLARARGSDEGRVRQWLQDRFSGPSNILFIIANRENDQPLGYMQFLGLDQLNRGADLGICVVPGIEGKGIGREALNLAIPYLRDVLAVHKISLSVHADNQIAIRCYASVGFEKCGLLREHVFMDQRWHDVMLMERILDSREIAQR